MTDGSATPESPGSPWQWAARVLRQSWNDLKSVYYANTLIWRFLKSGTLLFFGLFLWIGANLLLSYRPDWGFLWYVLSYGFVVIVWGPLTHLLVVPLVIRMRRSGDGPLAHAIAQYGTKTNLTVFFVLVVVLGTFPIGPMTFEFQLDNGEGSTDINPQLQCTKSSEEVHCHLSDPRGVDSLVVTSAGERVNSVDSPPYAFEVRIADLETVRGQKQFTVELRDENGNVVRRYIRRVDLIPGEAASE